jgi:hypothetical protein
MQVQPKQTEPPTTPQPPEVIPFEQESPVEKETRAMEPTATAATVTTTMGDGGHAADDEDDEEKHVTKKRRQKRATTAAATPTHHYGLRSRTQAATPGKPKDHRKTNP